MKIFATCFALCLLAVAALLYAEVTVNERQDMTMPVWVACANGGLGETVILEGPLHTLVTATINGNNYSGKYHFQPQGLSGYGETTGLKYQATGVTQGTFKGSLQNGQSTETYVNNFRIIGQGPGNNFLVHETMHITINANGDLKVWHDNFSAECK
jgi:hypothetical protein